MKTKTFFLLLLLMVGQSTILFSLAHPITPEEPDGHGDADAPYLVESLANLYWIAVETRDGNNFADAFFLQTQDLDAAETASWFEDKGWMPMGVFNTEPFSGTYNGDGHTISNLHVDRAEEDDVSLFGYVVGATIGNLGLINVSIVGDEFVGGMTGEAANSVIYDCFVSGNIKGSDTVGGISGALASSQINNAYNLSNLSGGLDVGGLAGRAEIFADKGLVDSSITNSYSAGSIHVLADDTKSDNPLQTERSTSGATKHNLRDKNLKGGKTGDLGIGGVVGYLKEGMITNCFFDFEVATSLGAEIDADNYGAIGKTTEEMQAPTTFSSWGGDIVENENIEKGYPFLAWQLDDKGEKNDPVWIIGTDASGPVAVPLSNTALHLSLLLMGGLVFYRMSRMG